MIFNPLCANGSFGNDNMFTTSAFISSLNGKLPNRNTTVTTQVDSDDIVHTLVQTLYKWSGREYPVTSRGGVNLFE